MDKYIDLGNGRVAIVDGEDYPEVSKHTWRLRKDGYVQRTYTNGDKTKHELLHRFIMKPKSNEKIDHKDGPRWDCRKSNLRKATNQENCFNRRPRNGRSLKGIYKHGKQWKARIKIDGKNIYIGIFGTPEEAARAYDEKARKLFGEFARLNYF